jgi:hypothetical protein
MKRFSAFVFALSAMATCFTSCDEENFVITPTNGCSKQLNYEVWCDCAQVNDDRAVSWLFLRKDGTFAKYDCKMQVNRNTLTPKNETDSVTGYWTRHNNDVTLDIELPNGQFETYTLNYDIVDGRCMLLNIEDASELLYEAVKDDTRTTFNVWEEVLNIYKSKGDFDEKVLEATVTVLSYVVVVSPTSVLENIVLPESEEMEEILNQIPVANKEQLKKVRETITKIISALLLVGSDLKDQEAIKEMLRQLDPSVLNGIVRSVAAFAINQQS